MKHQIKNDLFSVEVKEQGAELCSIRSLKTDREYIWQADPNIWNGSAPVLFPVIGHLKDNEYKYNGKTYTVPKHGFVRNNTKVKLVNQTPSRMSFLLSNSEDTLKQFPFKFDFKISFLLLENKLQVFHEVINLNDEPMYFSVGAHPAFNCPWIDGENYDDYYLEFEQTENANVYPMKPSGYLDKKEVPFIENSKVIKLTHEMFANDAKIFSELSSNQVTIKSKTNKNAVSVSFDDFPYLAIWAKPTGNFICIEPWDGLPDFDNSNKDFKSKTGNIKLEPGNTHYASYSIRILEK